MKNWGRYVIELFTVPDYVLINLYERDKKIKNWKELNTVEWMAMPLLKNKKAYVSLEFL